MIVVFVRVCARGLTLSWLITAFTRIVSLCAWTMTVPALEASCNLRNSPPTALDFLKGNVTT